MSIYLSKYIVTINYIFTKKYRALPWHVFS